MCGKHGLQKGKKKGRAGTLDESFLTLEIVLSAERRERGERRLNFLPCVDFWVGSTHTSFTTTRKDTK